LGDVLYWGKNIASRHFAVFDFVIPWNCMLLDKDCGWCSQFYGIVLLYSDSLSLELQNIQKSFAKLDSLAH
jgi:hypothetical protein